MMTFYEWRVKHSISQSSVALTTGEPPYKVQLWDSGEPLPKTIYKIFEKRFGISPKQFTYKEDE